jgi:hypothetical protein
MKTTLKFIRSAVFLFSIVTILSSCGIIKPNNNLKIISPKEKAILTYPRKTTVKWTSIPRADQYAIIIEYTGSPYDYSAKDYYAFHKQNEGRIYTKDTKYTFNGVGAQVHRFKVMAIKKDKILVETNWRYIDYSN